jgi:hypothetical protein
MADDTDVLLKIYEEQWAQGRQHENQRVTITNIVLLISSAVVGFIAQQGISPKTLPISILLIVIGIFGAVACAKSYERVEYHFERVRFLQNRLNELHPNGRWGELKEKADAEHNSLFPKLMKIHMHQFWIALHLIIMLFGIVLTIIALL